MNSAEYRDKYDFGGNREATIQADNEQCVGCGMSREEHKKKYGRDITVDHKDGRGRYSTYKNHSFDNLQTLCLPCHGRKDVKRVTHALGENHGQSKLTATTVLEARELLANGSTIMSVAKRFGVSESTINDMKQGRTWAWLKTTNQ